MGKSHTGQDQVTPEITQDRVMRIASLMVAMKWHGARTHDDLAQEWGVTADRVRQLAGEASRLIRVDPAHREKLRAMLAQRMLEIAEDAAVTRSNITGMPDYRARLEATEKAGKYMGCSQDEPIPSTAPQQSHRIVIAFEAVEPVETATPILGKPKP